MKLINSLILVALLGLVASCSTEQKQTANFEVGTINTPGVLCGSCAKNVQTALASLEGIEGIEVDLKKKIVEVKYVPAKTNLHSIESSIAGAGYDANETKRNAEAYEELDACCRVDG